MALDSDVLKQMIESLEEYVEKLEKALKKNKPDKINELRANIFDLHKKINKELQNA